MWSTFVGRLLTITPIGQKLAGVDARRFLEATNYELEVFLFACEILPVTEMVWAVTTGMTAFWSTACETCVC